MIPGSVPHSADSFMRIDLSGIHPSLSAISVKVFTDIAELLARHGITHPEWLRNASLEVKSGVSTILEDGRQKIKAWAQWLWPGETSSLMFLLEADKVDRLIV